jgi:hypothetical protein
MGRSPTLSMPTLPFSWSFLMLTERLSIVAVHGLNPTNETFHAEDTWKSGDKLWLRDFLPELLPRARVLLFGYNSNVAFASSTAGVREQAENLLNRLWLKRKVCG